MISALRGRCPGPLDECAAVPSHRNKAPRARSTLPRLAHPLLARSASIPAASAGIRRHPDVSSGRSEGARNAAWRDGRRAGWARLGALATHLPRGRRPRLRIALALRPLLRLLRRPHARLARAVRLDDRARARDRADPLRPARDGGDLPPPRRRRAHGRADRPALGRALRARDGRRLERRRALRLRHSLPVNRRTLRPPRGGDPGRAGALGTGPRQPRRALLPAPRRRVLPKAGAAAAAAARWRQRRAPHAPDRRPARQRVERHLPRDRRLSREASRAGAALRGRRPRPGFDRALVDARLRDRPRRRRAREAPRPALGEPDPQWPRSGRRHRGEPRPAARPRLARRQPSADRRAARPARRGRRRSRDAAPPSTRTTSPHSISSPPRCCRSSGLSCRLPRDSAARSASAARRGTRTPAPRARTRPAGCRGRRARARPSSRVAAPASAARA